MTKIAGLLLAAGTSSRMGRPKQTLPLGDRSLLDHALEQALGSDLDLVTLVLGHQAREIREALKTDLDHPKLEVIENRHYPNGISTSIIAGLSRVEKAYDHVMIILADMPRVTSEIINHLIRRYLASNLPLGAVLAREKRSHPVLFSRKFYPELHGLKGDMGARELFLKYPEEVCLVAPETPFEDGDIDTPQDYLDFQESLPDKEDQAHPENS